jgi:hypothetical protein
MFSLLFCGREENEYFQLFFDVVETVLQFRLDKNHSPGPHLGVVRTYLHPASSANHVIHLIFAMRFLPVDRAPRQNVNARTHGRHAQKFKIRLAPFLLLAHQFVDLKMLAQGVPSSRRESGKSDVFTEN